MTQEAEAQGSFFDEEERTARKYDNFKKRMTKAFGLPFEQIDPKEMRQFVHEVNEDERGLDEEVKREQEAEETRRFNAENLRLIKEAQEKISKIGDNDNEK